MPSGPDVGEIELIVGGAVVTGGLMIGVVEEYPFGNGEPGNGVVEVLNHFALKPVLPFAVEGSA